MNSESAVDEFFARIRSAGFFARLFSWKKIRTEAETAYRKIKDATSDAESAIQESRIKEDMLTTLNEEKDKRILEITNQAAQSSRDNAVLREKLAAEESKLISAKEAADTLAKEKQAKEEELIKAREELTIEKTRAATEKELHEAAKKDADELSKAKEEADAELAKVREEFTIEKTRAAAEKELHEAAKKEAEELAKAKEAADAELAKVREELSAERTRLTAEKEMREAVKTEAEELTRAKEAADADLAKVREELSAEKTRLEAEREAHAKIKADFEELAKEKLASDDTLVKTREKLSAAEEGLRIEQEKSAALKSEAESTAAELAAANEQLAAEESVKEERAAEYERRVSSLNTLIDQMKEDHRRAEERIKEEMEAHNELLSSAWQRHEKEVEENLKGLAKRYDFIRCEKCDYPYSGTPDNVFLVGGMYTIFDAKSPKNPEDLENFPAYLKQQAEGMKKYCKNENVRKDAFLVVPSSTADVLTTFVYPLADYTVYVITPDAVLPILQMLKTIEAYDFAEQLSPDDRDKLCRFIGKLSHTAKRKIQIDTYLSQEFVSVLRESASLPEEFAKDIVKYEQQAKLNPPIEKRAKIIAVEDIASDVAQVERDILGWAKIE